MSIPSCTSSIAWRSKAELECYSVLLLLEQGGQVGIAKEVLGVGTNVGPS